MSAKQSLGRGFDALIPQNLDRSILESDNSRIQNLLIQDIKPNPQQPRREFGETALNELSSSIKSHGVMQPIIVVRDKDSNGYIIVAGERRWRAAQQANLKNIPAIVRSLKELEQIEMALIENIQRVDLSPLEQSLAVYRLQHQFNLSLKEVADKLGKAHSTVSNIGRLLQLPDEAKEALASGQISEGHARSILALKGNDAKQLELLRSIVNNNWTVRQAEEFVLDHKRGSKALQSSKLNDLTSGLSTKLKAPVKIKQTANGGQIIITFKNEADLDRINDSLSK